jgi:transglutaminase-like putative cysteine protease
MRAPAWTYRLITVLAMVGLFVPATAGFAETVEGSFWYAIDNINRIDDGARALIWATLPAEWHGQKIDIVDIVPKPVSVTTDPESRNQVVEWLWEPRAWEMLPETEPRHFFFHYDFTLDQIPVQFVFDPASVEPYDKDSDLYQTFTKADTWIQTDGPVRDTALQIVGTETNPGLQARLLYHWILENLTFVPGGEGGRDAAATLASKRGDCGQYSTLFTAFCRSVGIPARNVQLVWLDGGLHDISEIFLPGYGWFPVDTSVGQMLLPGHAGYSEQEVTAFAKVRDIPLGDADFCFGNLAGYRLAVSRGVNVRFESPTLGRLVTLQRMRPGGIDASPEGFILEGFNSSVVHGGFFVFDEKVIDEEAAHALTHQRLANSFFKEGLNEMTEDGCRQSLDKYSDGVQPWINLGKVYMHKGEYYKAEAAFKRAINGAALQVRDKGQAIIWAHNYLGNCYDILGHRQLAEKEYQQVVDNGQNFRGAVDYARKYLDRPFRKEVRGN